MLGSVRSSLVCKSWRRWPHRSDVGTEDLPPTTVPGTFDEALSGAGRLVLSVPVYPWTGLPLSLSSLYFFPFFCWSSYLHFSFFFLFFSSISSLHFSFFFFFSSTLSTPEHSRISLFLTHKWVKRVPFFLLPPPHVLPTEAQLCSSFFFGSNLISFKIVIWVCILIESSVDFVLLHVFFFLVWLVLFYCSNFIRFMRKIVFVFQIFRLGFCFDCGMF